MAPCGEGADVLRIERIPGIDAGRRAVFPQRFDIAGVGRFGMGRESPLDAQALQEAGHPSRERLAHAPRAVSASVTISPMRTRKSVLIVGR